MLKKPISLIVGLGVAAGFAWVAGCSSKDNGNNNNPPPVNTENNSSTASSTTSSSGTTGGDMSSSSSSSGSAAASDDGGGMTDAAGGDQSLVIDDQSVSTGTAISPGSALKALVPAGGQTGTWYEYGSDDSMAGAIRATLMPNPFALTPQDAGMFSKAACLSSPGYVGYSAGMGLNFATTMPDDAGKTTTLDVDLSGFTGVTFWAQGMTTAAMHVKFPDDQTDSGDANAACKSADAGTDPTKTGCDDAFFSPVTLTSDWTQVTINFMPYDSVANMGGIQQAGFGAQFTALDLKHVRQLQFEDEGAGTIDGGAMGFNICIADISFTK